MPYSATECLYRLADFAVEKGLVAPIDRAYTVNRLLEIMGMEAPEDIEYIPAPAPETATVFLGYWLGEETGRNGFISAVSLTACSKRHRSMAL